MLKTFVIEDNSLELANVLEFLALKCPQVEVVGTSGEIGDAYAGIVRTRPDLLISDIQIIGGLCYELLNRLKKARRLHELRIIFMTRFRDFENAKNGYEYSPIAFLEKPFTATELQIAVDKLGQPEVIPQAGQQLDAFLDYLGQQASPGQRLTVSLLGGTLQMVELADIVYLEAKGSMTDFHLKDTERPLVSNKGIGHYAGLLRHDARFFSVERGVIINLTQLDRYDHGERRITLKGPTRHVYASRSGGQNLRQYLLQNPLPDAAAPDSFKVLLKKLFGMDDS